ncbi:unnamed protein product [Clavelina lepadiformis]|uniref:Peptidase A2 domain-containing protein n=1 Tax=Clavelina lepadiformis TaxID=159417 RepID=A0ABP0GQX4_CLALP
MLCKYFHEDPNELLLKEDEDVPLNPCIVAHGPDVLTSKRFYIFVDKKCAFDYINSALEAVTLPSACYYVFNVRYPEELSATLELLQRLVHEYLYLVTIVINIARESIPDVRAQSENLHFCCVPRVRCKEVLIIAFTVQVHVTLDDDILLRNEVLVTEQVLERPATGFQHTSNAQGCPRCCNHNPDSSVYNRHDVRREPKPADGSTEISSITENVVIAGQNASCRFAPFFDVIFRDKVICALVDTGASVFIIKKSLWDGLNYVEKAPMSTSAVETHFV